MATYTVTVTREDDLWVAVVHGLPPTTSGAMDYQHLAELHDDIPLFIADLVSVDDADVTVAYRYEVNGRDVTDALGRFLSIESQISDRLAEREAARRDAIRVLTSAGLSRRATGDAVGLSGGRVQQLVER